MMMMCLTLLKPRELEQNWRRGQESFLLELPSWTMLLLRKKELSRLVKTMVW
uniref:Uncharacterized protein n=1 Tax=Hyaloperonospora arabidopsidis (strain Emoy2) TaxID=559515 RepID=M4C4Y4_HYAAE